MTKTGFKTWYIELDFNLMALYCRVAKTRSGVLGFKEACALFLGMAPDGRNCKPTKKYKTDDDPSGKMPFA